jgi:hypothetical protein
MSLRASTLARIGWCGNNLRDRQTEVRIGLETIFCTEMPFTVSASVSLIPLTLQLIEYWISVVTRRSISVVLRPAYCQITEDHREADFGEDVGQHLEPPRRYEVRVLIIRGEFWCRLPSSRASLQAGYRHFRHCAA